MFLSLRRRLALWAARRLLGRPLTVDVAMDLVADAAGDGAALFIDERGCIIFVPRGLRPVARLLLVAHHDARFRREVRDLVVELFDAVLDSGVDLTA